MSLPSSIVICFCFLFVVIPQQIRSESISDLPECSGRRIHVRNLPQRFNLDLLLNCSNYPVYDDFCPYISNHGLGPKTHNRTISWYRTDLNMLELIFHRRFLEYPCLTKDPATADAIFLPYYSFIDAIRYLYGSDTNSSAEHGLDLFDFLQSDSPEIWNRNHGHDHFLVMAGQAWDFSQLPTVDPPVWGTSFLEIPEFFNVTALTLESRTWPWQEQAVPYPTSFHPPSIGFLKSWIERVRKSQRTTLMLFAGGGGTSVTPTIRRSIRDECENSSWSLCEVVDCSKGVCEHDPILYMKPMLRATFCLQPPGDTPTRRATFDGILAGCIPVFFEEASAKNQFGWHLPEAEYEDFSVTIPKEDVVLNGLKIVDVLQKFGKDDVLRMRNKVIELIPKIMYRRHGSSVGLQSKVKDAFDLAIEGVLRRVKAKSIYR